MADKTKSNNGGAKQAGEGTAPIQIQAKVVSQYLKDLSFENPNVRKLITGPGDPPSLKIEVNVNAERLDNGLFESAIELNATASNASIGTIYVLETVYAGLFQIDSIPEAALEPLLLISGPTTLFPFLRRIVADTTREGGFPPLLLDPIDFAALYNARKQEAGKKTDS
jgi:preprotein translocase subunit SecB